MAVIAVTKERRAGETRVAAVPETVKKLEWVLSRATGYFGVTNYLGSRFLTSDTGMNAFAGALRGRGLAFVDDGQAARRGGGVPRGDCNPGPVQHCEVDDRHRECRDDW